MRNLKIRFTVSAVLLAGTIGAFSVFAHEGEGNGMMSAEGMPGMGGMMGMMNMMSDMSPEDRKAMMESCMKMMQSHSSDKMSGAEKESADVK